MVAQEDLGVGGVKEDETDFADGRRRLQKRFDGRGNDGRRTLARVAVRARGDGGEGDGAQLVFCGESQGVAVAGGEGTGVWFGVAATDRADCVDYVFCGEIASDGDDGLPGGEAVTEPSGAEPAAFVEDARSAATMDRAVDATSSEKRAVGCVDNGVDVLRGDIADEDLDAVAEEGCESIRN